VRISSSHMRTNSRRLETELEDRKRNLAVVQEAITTDSVSGRKLIPVRDFLTHRIEQLEGEIKNRGQTVAAV
jgi:hypothetical protein